MTRDEVNTKIHEWDKLIDSITYNDNPVKYDTLLEQLVDAVNIVEDFYTGRIR